MIRILINNKKHEGSLLKYLNYWILLFFFYSFIGSAYAAESDPPVLNAISVDKTVVDVSNGPQTVTFTTDTYDASGIDWNSSNIRLRTVNMSIVWVNSNHETPNTFSITFDTNSTSGLYLIDYMHLYDNVGNPSNINSSSLLNFGLPSHIEVIGGAESDPPVLNAISVDKTVVDVSNGPQTVTFTTDTYDASGIDWNSSNIRLRTVNMSIVWVNSNHETPNTFSITFDTNSTSGLYLIDYMHLYDNVGNPSNINSSSLLNFGLPSHIEVIGENSNFDFDFDKNGTLDALTDGLLLLRYAFGLRGENLTNAAISSESTLTPQEVEANIEQAAGIADIDNNGSIDALTDGLLLLRYAFGLRGDNLIDGAISSDSTRTSAEDIEAYIESHIP